MPSKFAINAQASNSIAYSNNASSLFDPKSMFYNNQNDSSDLIVNHRSMNVPRNDLNNNTNVKISPIAISQFINAAIQNDVRIINSYHQMLNM